MHGVIRRPCGQLERCAQPTWMVCKERGRARRIDPTERLRRCLGRGIDQIGRRIRERLVVTVDLAHRERIEHAPEHRLLARTRGAIFDQPTGIRDAFAQHAQREAKIELARVGRERRACIWIEPAIRDQEVAALELLDRLTEHPRERAIDALVGEQTLALEDPLCGDDAGVQLVGGLPSRVRIAELAIGRQRRVIG